MNLTERKEKTNPVQPNWLPVNFSSLQTKLTVIKYKCLQFSKFNRNKIDIDVSDIMEKFKKVDVKFDIKRR